MVNHYELDAHELYGSPEPVLLPYYKTIAGSFYCCEAG
jgi:hypothetical protein